MRAEWRALVLGEACEVIAGQSPAGSAYNSLGQGLPFYQGKKEFDDKYIGPPTTWTTEVTKRAIANDILMSVRAPVGPINFATQEICIGRGLAAIRAKPGLDQNFLFYFLLSIQPQISGRDGAVFPSISRDEICALELSLPPLPQQQRIVAILDEAFAGLATATANAEKNLKNARELFESYLNSIFTQGGEQWTARPIGDMAEVFDGPHATPKTVEVGPVFLGISALKDGIVDLSETRHVTVDDFERWTRRVRPRTDDVVFSYETRLGQAATIPEGLECCLGRRMGLVRCDRSKIEPRFFLYQYLAKPFQDFLRSRTVQGATVDRISIKDFPAFKIKVAPLAEQRQIVAALDRFAEYRASLEEKYRRKLDGLADLKQSILQKAFSGELTSPPLRALKEAAE